MIVIRSHDALFRFVFGEPEQMGELLRSSLPPAVVAAIDWGELRRVDGSFVGVELQGRHADLLFEARLGEVPLLLFVLVEHKSGEDRFTALQLLRYVVRVWDGWLAANPRARSLPPVLPFVVHHGKKAWRAPRSVRALVALEGVPAHAASFLRALQPELVFLLDDLAAATEQSLAARAMSAVAELTLRFLQFLRLRRPATATEDISLWQEVVQRLFDPPRGRTVLQALISWFLARDPTAERRLRTIMARIEDPKTRQTMKSALDQLLERGFAKGLERGLEQGLERQRELVRRQLATRFGAIPDDVEARLASATSDELLAWGTRILTARSLAELFLPA